MTLFHRLRQIILTLLFVAFGTVSAFSSMTDWEQAQYHSATQNIALPFSDVGFAARAPPSGGANVTTKVTLFTGNGDAHALDGAQTQWASLDFSQSSIATNRGIPTTTAQTQNLRTNLQRDGFRFDPGEEAHHIVAKNDPRAAEARQLLGEAGVDVNSPANGVPLPGTRTTPNPNNKAVHRGDVIHSQGYYDYVNSELRNVPASQRPQVVRRIADELERGEINW